MTTAAKRAAYLRKVAEYHSLELAGASRILWPRSTGKLELLREAWKVIEPEARAGTLTGELALCNFGDDWQPYAAYLWPD